MSDGKNGGWRPGSGRPKGVPNKLSGIAKENLDKAFEELGGWEAFAKWGKQNPTEFYTIWSKILPKEIALPPMDDQDSVTTIIIEGVEPPPRDEPKPH